MTKKQEEMLRIYWQERRRLWIADLISLVDEAAEVVKECPVTGAAGARWREEWLERAAALGLSPLKEVDL